MEEKTLIFIEKAYKIHKNKYDYSLVLYEKSNKKVKIKCNICNYVNQQTPNDHLNGCGCPICANNRKLTTKQYIKKASEIHGEKYNYNMVDYKVGKTKIKIHCKNCDMSFIQRADHHLRGSGCPTCNFSKGENKIKKYLNNNNNITFIPQHRFDDCKGDSRCLPFDFYIKEKNILIEYDGVQHYKPTEKFGGLESFIIRQKYDEIKNNYTEKEGIKLIRIPYTKYNNIDKILKEQI